MSTDQAHSLGDAFGTKLSNIPIKITDNLEAIEVDAIIENEVIWGNIKVYIEKLMLLKTEKSIEVEELLVFPGFQDLISLLKIKQINDENNYDVLIVDCAPTGETMSLLKFPELFKWWMEKFFPMKRKAAKIVKPIIDHTIKIPVPDEKTFDEIENLYNKIYEFHELMLQKDNVSLRIVTTPENIVVKEAKRNFSYLHLYNFNVDAIIVNKIMPKEGGKGYLEKWMELQSENLKDISESFSPVPIFKTELKNSEIRNYDSLLNMGKNIFKEVSGAEVFFKDKIFRVKKSSTDGSYYLIINIPFLDKKELSFLQKGDEISISIKNEKRNFMLPQKLQSKEIIKVSYEEGKLRIQFN